MRQVRGQIWGHGTGMGHWSLTQHGHKEAVGPLETGQSKSVQPGCVGPAWEARCSDGDPVAQEEDGGAAPGSWGVFGGIALACFCNFLKFAFN